MCGERTGHAPPSGHWNFYSACFAPVHRSTPKSRCSFSRIKKITKKLAKQVERVTEIVAQSNISLFSRVQIKIEKPEGDRTPDLLYALRLYLTGDDGANAIHISSVSDSDHD